MPPPWQGARGIYLWWPGCHKMLLLDCDAAAAATKELAATSAAPPPTPPAGAKPATPPAKPSTPPKGAAAPAPGSIAAAAPPALPPHMKQWVMPHALTAACSTADGMMLAFGMADGTALLWDDKFGEPAWRFATPCCGLLLAVSGLLWAVCTPVQHNACVCVGGSSDWGSRVSMRGVDGCVGIVSRVVSELQWPVALDYNLYLRLKLILDL